MNLTNSPTELTTAATDAILGFICLGAMTYLARFRQVNRQRARIWVVMFGLLSLASFLGAFAHGLELMPARREWIWQPLYLSLGITVALFVAAGHHDMGMRKFFPHRRLAASIIIGGLFYAITALFSGAFIIFVVYELIAMLITLAIYAVLAARYRLRGAATVTIAIGLNIVAAAIQASSLSMTLVWRFDHNGLFHLVQMVALITLAVGVGAGMNGTAPRSTDPGFGEQSGVITLSQ